MPPPAEGFAARFVLGPALRTQPDRRLVTLVREGYENAFEEIVRRYGKPLTRYAAAIVGGRAEDVTQDAFSKALLALRREGAEIELRPWLFRIVRNTALNDLRDRPPSAAVLAETIASGANPAEELERREELADLMRRLHSLPEAQRAAIVMRELEGLSHEEIAAALGLSGGAARQAIFRARRALRDSAGMLLPLPLLKALLAGAATAPLDATAGAASLGSAAGAGVAIKAATATVLVAGAVGAGVAIDRSHQGGQIERASAHSVAAASPTRTVGPTPPSTPGSEAANEHAGPRPGNDKASAGSRDDSSGEPDQGHGGGESGSHDGGRGLSGGSRHGDEGNSTTGGGHGGTSGSSGPGAAEGDGSGGEGLDDSSGPSEESVSDGGDLGPDGGSDSNSGPDSGDDGGGPGDESPTDESDSGDSGDSHGGHGFTQQTEPQTQEEP